MTSFRSRCLLRLDPLRLPLRRVRTALWALGLGLASPLVSVGAVETGIICEGGDRQGQVREPAGRANGSMAFAPDGGFGMVLAESDLATAPAGEATEWKRLLYHFRSADGSLNPPEEIICFQPSHRNAATGVALFYETSGAPLVVTYGGRGLIVWSRVGGSWVALERVYPGPEIIDPSEVLVLSSMAATQTADGALHFVFYGWRPGVGVELIYARRTGLGGWHWEVVKQAPSGVELNELTAFEYVEVKHLLGPRNLDLAVDGSGTVHLVYSWGRSVVPVSGGSQVRSDLFYATNAGGTWSSRTLLTPGTGFGDFGLGASVAVSPNGQVAAAVTWIPRVATGSPGQVQLWFLVKTPGGDWSEEVVAVVDDGYGLGTGLFPKLVIDEDARPHLVFADHTAQHFPGFGSLSFAGQVRYATRPAVDSGAWALRSLVGRGNSMPIDFQTYDIDLAASRGGVAVGALSYRWDAGRSVYSKEPYWEVLAEAEPAPVVGFLPPISYALGEGWYWNTWLDFFWVPGPEFVWQVDYGWLFVNVPGNSAAGAWLFLFDHAGWYWFSESLGAGYAYEAERGVIVQWQNDRWVELP